MNPPADDERKIIIDEDWKSQIERERAAQREGGSQEERPEEAMESAGEIPPATFPFLVSTIYTQTLVSMGQIRDPLDDQTVVRLDVAKHHIDMLGLLREKTRGNLTPEEAEMLDEVLHQVRMLFIAVSKQSAGDSETE